MIVQPNLWAIEYNESRWVLRERRKPPPILDRQISLIRQFFPKGTNFKIVKQAEIDRVTDLINHRPQKSLDYRTPYEIL